MSMFRTFYVVLTVLLVLSHTGVACAQSSMRDACEHKCQESLNKCIYAGQARPELAMRRKRIGPIVFANRGCRSA
jgi:hypothetical protein